MKQTSFELAKQVHDKGIKIENTEYWTNKACVIINKDVLLIHPEYKEGSYPAPTLDEWLDYLPMEIELITVTYRLTVMPQSDNRCTVGYMRAFGNFVYWSAITSTSKNACDAAAEVAILAREQ